MRAAAVAEPIHEASPVDDALDVGEADRRGVVVGVPVEVVGDRHRRRVAGRHGPADADPARPRHVHEARHEVAALAGHADAPGRRVRRHDLGAQVGRRADHALAVRAGEQDAELVGERDELGLGDPPLVTGFAVAGRGEERRP